MKFTKLSLAAIVALGTLSAANAKTPLEEAIKGTTINGFVEARYYDREDDGDLSTKSTNNWSRYRIDLEVSTKIDDKLSLTVGQEMNYNESGSSTIATSGSNQLSVDNAYFTYTNAGIMAKVGRQNVATPWTDGGFNGSDGNGVFATYKVNDAITLGGAHFTNTTVKASAIPTQDIQALALIGKVSVVDVQAWYLKAASTGSWAYLNVAAPVGPLKIQAQYNQYKPDATGSDDESFYALKASGKFSGVSLSAGYMASDDVKNSQARSGLTWIDGGDGGGVITAGKLVYADIVNYDDLSAYFATAAYTMDKVTLSAGIVNSSFDVQGTERDEGEYYGQVAYKYNKKLAAAIYYADRDSDVNTDDRREIRASVKYSF